MQFDWADDFHEGRARIEVNGKIGFIDKIGKIVVEPVYDEAKPFNEGLAPVGFTGTRVVSGEEFNTEKWGYIDQSGKVIIPFTYSEAEQFSEGLACVELDDEVKFHTSGFIDRAGRTFIDFQYTGCTGFDRGIASIWLNNRHQLINKDQKVIWETANK